MTSGALAHTRTAHNPNLTFFSLQSRNQTKGNASSSTSTLRFPIHSTPPDRAKTISTKSLSGGENVRAIDTHSRIYKFTKRLFMESEIKIRFRAAK